MGMRDGAVVFEDPRIAEYEARIAALEARVSALSHERPAAATRPVFGFRPGWLERYAIIGVWIALIAAFALIESQVSTRTAFFTWFNFRTMFGTQGVLVLLTFALLVPLTAGDFDLSVAATMTLSALVATLLIIEQGMPTGLAVLAALLAGAAVGAINAFFILYFRIHSLVVTLAMSTFIVGIAKWISASQTVTLFASNASRTLVALVNQTRLLGISMSFWIAVVLCIVMWWVLQRTTLGRRLLFVGRARDVARLAGIDTDRMRAGALVASGVIAALAGVVAVGMTGSADATTRLPMLLPAFAGAFLGATSIIPGRFNPIGSLIGVYLLATGIAGLQIFGIPNFVQDLFWGGGLIVAVCASQLVRRRQPMEIG